MEFLACYVFQYCDMSSFRPAPLWAIKLQANCCSFVPLAVLGGVDEQSVLTGEAIEKIGHCCQDTGKATEDLRKIRQAVLKPHGCTSSTLQSALKMGSNYLVMLTDGTFLPCFHFISIQMSPDEAFQLCVRFLWGLLQDIMVMREVSLLNPWQQCTAILLLLCQRVSGVSDPSIIRGERATQKKATDYSVVEQEQLHLTTGGAVVSQVSQGKSILPSCRRTGEGAGGRSRREQKRYNFTAEHARLVLQCEQGRISHLR